MRPSLQRLARAAAREGGAMMMFVLMAALLIAMVTLGVMRMVAGDVSEGFGGLEAVQAFNIAEAGAHYAMGQLQGAGASTYTGETLTVTNGSVTLGTAAITVNCIDTGTAPPCGGTYASYRRIVSTSTLPMSGLSGGPTRTIVAIVQALSGSAPFGLCATTSSPAPGYYGVMIGGSGEGGGSVFTDVASNSTVYVSGSGLVLRADASSRPPSALTTMIAAGTRASPSRRMNSRPSTPGMSRSLMMMSGRPCVDSAIRYAN